MKKIFVNIFNVYNSINLYLKKKGRFGLQKSAEVIMMTFIICGILSHWGNDIIKIISGCLFTVIIFGIILFFEFDIEDKMIKRVTKQRCETMRQLLRELNHTSYIYGLFVVTLEICVLVEIIILAVTGFMVSGFIYKDMMNLWIIIMFIYTILYFSYHIYTATEEKSIERVEHRIQLYTAIGTTISFLMMILGKNDYFDIFISGTLMEFVWLEYMIAGEKSERYQ